MGGRHDRRLGRGSAALGTLGQLPVALIAAAGLRWLLARFESAVHEIRIALAAVPSPLAFVALVALVRNPADRNLLLVPAAGASLAKRGPPPRCASGRTDRTRALARTQNLRRTT